MNTFNVINFDVNVRVFKPYEVLGYFESVYKENKKKLSSFQEFKNFIESESRYRFWARCEYEIILTDWPVQEISEKWDIHNQIMMNIDIITKLFMENILSN